ncbi:MAG TPA: hypothetical protein VFR17_03170 [Mycobacterium sp.]|nr:hypothetical protein [Mycobacterium sp.]
MPGAPGWVKIFDVNPRVIARHTAPITCQVNQVAASIRDWFPNANASIRDTLNALQRTLSVDGYVDGLCRLLNISVETVSDEADVAGREDRESQVDQAGG